MSNLTKEQQAQHELDGLKIRCFNLQEHIQQVQSQFELASGALANIAGLVKLETKDNNLDLGELIKAVEDLTKPKQKKKPAKKVAK